MSINILLFELQCNVTLQPTFSFSKVLYKVCLLTAAPYRTQKMGENTRRICFLCSLVE